MQLSGHPTNTQTYQTLVYRRALHPELFPPKARRLVERNAYELESWITQGGHVLRFRFGPFCCCELVTDQEDRLPMDGAVTSFPCAGEHEFEHRFDNERVGYMTSVQTETLSENLYAATYEEMEQLAQENDALIYRWTDLTGTEAATDGSRLLNGRAPGHSHGYGAGNGNGNGRSSGRTATNGHSAIQSSYSGASSPVHNGHATLTGHAPQHHHTNGNGNGNGHDRHRGASGRNLSLLDIQRLAKEIHIQSYHLIARGGFVLRTQTIFEHR